jgi:hypothetical protein
LAKNCKTGPNFSLTRDALIDSLISIIRDRTLKAREKLFESLPVTRELLRGSLLDRIVHQTSGCPKCERGEGYAVSVLTVSYPGGRTCQISVRPERVAEVVAG